MSRPNRGNVLLLVLLTGAAACKSPTEVLPAPAALQVVSPQAVVVPAGTTASDSIAVRVVDSRNRGVPGIPVAWSGDPQLAATVSPWATTTDGNGVARAELKAGTTARPAAVTATATIGGVPVTVTFEVTVAGGPPATIEMSASATLGVGATRTIAAVVRDAHGNVIGNPDLQWSSSNSAVAEVIDGAVSGKAIGGARIKAMVGSVSGEMNVWVVPHTISSCERNTGVVCGTWTLQNDRYYVTWSDQVTSFVYVVRFDGSQVEFYRTDLTKNVDFTARYTGTITGRTSAGPVTWTQHGFSWSGAWDAQW